jgi:hypothetical protein
MYHCCGSIWISFQALAYNFTAAAVCKQVNALPPASPLPHQFSSSAVLLAADVLAQCNRLSRHFKFIILQQF